MALWKFGRGWSEATMKRYLADLEHRSVSFEADPNEMDANSGWTVDGAEKELAVEPPGPPVPDGAFERARQGLINYDFSDPTIVKGHFDPEAPFVGRNMLLEIKVPLLLLRFLGGVRVHSVRDTSNEERSVFGFRYDTLEGHIESGYEWFLLTKDHQTGQVRFKIEAHWRLGTFPNWWSRLGFRLVGERFREAWRQAAPRRLQELIRRPVPEPVAEPGHLAHRGDPTPTLTQPTDSGS